MNDKIEVDVLVLLRLVFGIISIFPILNTNLPNQRD